MPLQEQLQQIINNKTKPLGALGQLEEIALQVGLGYSRNYRTTK